MIEKYTNTVIRWRYAVVLLTLVWVVLAASGGRLLQLTTDYRIYFGKENPQLKAFDKMQETYNKNDNVFFIIAPANGDVFTPENLGMVQKLTKAAWQIPFSTRVDSITNYQHTYAEEDDLVVEDLVQEPMQLSSADLTHIRTIAINEPLLRNRLISPTSHVTGVNVTVHLPGKDTQKEPVQVAQYARKLSAEFHAQYPTLKIYLTGMVMMNNAFPEASTHDAMTLTPIMFLLVFIMIGVLLRSVAGTITTLFVIVFMIVAVMGMVGWVGIFLTPVVVAAPTIILTIGVADCVHILVSFLTLMRNGMEKQAAMVESLRINFNPVFLTSFTTSIGFLSMNFSDSPPFRDLGNVVCMGVMIAFFLSITFLPAFMMILPLRTSPTKGKERSDEKIMRKFAEFVIKQRNPLLVGMTCCVIVLAACIPKNELNDEFVKFFERPIPFRIATDFASKNLNGLYLIEYSLPAGESQGISEPKYLQQVESFAQWYRSQPETLHVNTITDTLKRLNKNLHADKSEWYRLPDNKELAAQYLLLYEMSLPFGLDMNNQIDLDKSTTRFVVTTTNLTTNQILALEAKAQSWLQENAPTIRSDGTGATIMFSHIGARNIRSMIGGTTLALFLISFILIFALRSVKIGFISLIPNLAPACMAFGLWGMLVGEVGLALSVVTGMTLGIVVDDTIHFLSKYLRARREQNMDSQAAVHYAFVHVGMALTITSLVLISGFLVLSLSAFQLNADMGLMTAITIVFALLADFLLLPPILMKMKGPL